jgi:hypothetical protein
MYEASQLAGGVSAGPAGFAVTLIVAVASEIAVMRARLRHVLIARSLFVRGVRL